jgi:hypothetical protein
MTTTTIKKGDRVNVYQDPFTCAKLEGRATIKNIVLDEGADGVRCKVIFDDERQSSYERLIVHPLGIVREGED